MSGAQAAALGMLAPAAGVAAMQGLLLDLAAARSPRSAAGALDCDMSGAQVWHGGVNEIAQRLQRLRCTVTSIMMDLPACLYQDNPCLDC